MMLRFEGHVFICLYFKVSCWSSPLDEDGMSAVTMWIVGDYEKVSGRKLLVNALKHLVSSIYCSLLSPFHPIK